MARNTFRDFQVRHYNADFVDKQTGRIIHLRFRNKGEADDYARRMSKGYSIKYKGGFAYVTKRASKPKRKGLLDLW